MGNVVQYCTFSVERLSFAVEVDRVQEVMRYSHVTRVPLAPAIVAGLMNLRGDIVTAIDMRARLALPPRAPGTIAMSVVLRRADGAISLLVDRIGDVIEVAQDSLMAVPQTIPSGVREVSRGVIAWERELLLLLDTNRAVPEDPAPKVRRNSDKAPTLLPRVAEVPGSRPHERFGAE
jgi:purine-binding chemotaxis protein CheW